MVWTSKPSLSFGSNHVDFGGMMPPSSDIAIKSWIVTGYIEKATAAWPLATAVRARSPARRRRNRIRLSVRMSSIFSSGASTRMPRRATSSDCARKPPAGAAPDRSIACYLPSRYIDTSPFRRGVGVPSVTGARPRSACRNCAGVRSARSFTRRLYARIFTCVSGNATAMNVSLSPSFNSACARAALAARWWPSAIYTAGMRATASTSVLVSLSPPPSRSWCSVVGLEIVAARRR